MRRNYDYLSHTTFRPYLIDFQLNLLIFLIFIFFKIFFTIKSLGVTQRTVSQENAFNRSKNPVAFFFFSKYTLNFFFFFFFFYCN